MAKAILRSRADLDDSPFRTGIARMGADVRAFSGGQLKAVGKMIGGAFAVGAVVNFAKSQMEAADRTMDLATNLGISTEAIGALEAAAITAGGSTEGVQKALGKLASTKPADMTLAQYLESVARKYVEAGEGGAALAEVQKVMGRSAYELTGILHEVGTEGLQSIIDKGKEAGTVLDEDVTAALSRANDALAILSKRGGNWLTRQAAKVGGNVANISSFWGAVSGVGFGEAVRQRDAGEIGLDSEIRAAAEERRKNQEKRMAAEKVAAELEATQEADKLRASFAKKAGNISVSAPSAADSLAAMGAYVGGQSSGAKGQAERMVKIAELQSELQEKLVALAEKSGVALETIADAVEE